MTITVPSGVVPIQVLSSSQVLYGSRVTSYRFELLTHSTTTGLDTLTGYLDGVKLGGTLNWVAKAAVKRSGTIDILDLTTAAAGLMRARDVDLVTTRIRPVLTIQGLPEIPLSVYVVTAAPEEWTATGRTFKVEMHDKSTVLDQDLVPVTYTVPAGAVVLSAVQTVISSAGESISVDGNTKTLANDMVWPVGTSKLKIVNDLLGVLNYNALWVDGVGAFRATPYLLPVKRPINYAILNDASGNPLPRQLVDGAQSIYSTDWALVQDSYGVPNQVVAVEQATGTAVPLTGTWSNTDPTSPYSYPSRGRWIVSVLPSVAVPAGSSGATTTFLQARAQRSLIASSAVQAAVTVKCLPIPVDLLDAIRFESTPAGVDGRYTVQSVALALSFDGLMDLTLQEVVSL